jgi:hypothetical protein
LIRCAFTFGGTGITLIGLLIIVASFFLPIIIGKNAGYALVCGVIVILFGNLFWRVACEVFIVMFKISDSLVSIDNKLKKQE